jgi:uncharacterized integral membrane protein
MKLKLAVSLVLAFLAFIFITQNTQIVGVRFLAWSVDVSLVVMVFILLGSGVIIGWLLNSYLRFSSRKKHRDPVVEPKTAELSVELESVNGTEGKSS